MNSERSFESRESSGSAVAADASRIESSAPGEPSACWRGRLREFACRAGVFGLLAAAALGSGCAHVNPWERGALADPTMRADRDPVGGMMAEHMWFSREAASGGRGVGGGGCGCN